MYCKSVIYDAASSAMDCRNKSGNHSSWKLPQIASHLLTVTLGLVPRVHVGDRVLHHAKSVNHVPEHLSAMFPG
jgi:hypothetical protein